MPHLEDIPIIGTIKRYMQYRESPLETWAVFLTTFGLFLMSAIHDDLRRGIHHLEFVNILGTLFSTVFFLFLLRRIWIAAMLGAFFYYLLHGPIRI